MKQKLMIVESPAKARKIAGFLGAGWRVEASLGHVYDLPERELGVDVDRGFALRYEIIPGKKAIVGRLINAMQDADQIYMATDPDREGEAIAWNIVKAARLPKSKPVFRVTFTSITQAAVLAAIAVPRQLDMDLIQAQQTRRAVDRLTGYLASSLTSRALDQRLSAGRVQSVALRLLVDREREIAAFVPHKHWSLSVSLKAVAGEFLARLTMLNDQPVSELTQAQAQSVLAKLANGKFWVKRVEQTVQSQPPAPPFTTASLQQEAGRALGLAPEDTMKLAQSFYEAGLITFIRTDGVEVSAEAQRDARDYLVEQCGAESVPEVPPVYTARQNAQEAHEAIRPTDISRGWVGGESGVIADPLYALIRRRFLASQMAPARFVRTKVTIHIGSAPGQSYPLVFEAHGSRPIAEGFLKMYRESPDDGDLAPEESDSDALPFLLPTMAEREPLVVVEWHTTEQVTRPPDHYSEAALVQALETRGIGRPATYAPTVSLLKEKGYATRQGKRLIPTETGKRLCEFLVAQFADIFEYQYTAWLESELDRVAAGKATHVDVMEVFWASFKPSLNTVGELVNRWLAERPQPKLLGKLCPNCGKPLLERDSRYGSFAACSGYPTCRYTAPLAPVSLAQPVAAVN